MAMRLKLRGANGSPSTASTRAVHARRPSGDFAQDEIARLGVLQIGNRQLAPLFLLDGSKPEAFAFLAHDAEHQLGRAHELLHRVGGIALAALLGPGEDAVADAERAAPAALENAEAWRRSVGVPLLGHREDVAAVVGLDDPQHGDLRHAARLVEGAAGGAVDQTLVGHVLEQSLEQDLVLPRQAEGPRDLALAGRLVGRRDEVEDLLAAGQAGGPLVRSIARRS